MSTPSHHPLDTSNNTGCSLPNPSAAHQDAGLETDAELTTAHQRFVVQGWVRFLKGQQSDLRDRYLQAEDGSLTEHEAVALVIDGNKQPERVERLRAHYDRQFYSPQLGCWV